MPKFKIGEVVKTVNGSEFEGVGPVIEVKEPSRELRLLWGSDEPHYIFRDNESGEYISAIERNLEKA